MKERGILFSAPMVRALLTGTKTMTRRLAKETPCRYGFAGDRLWVRETWGFDSGVRADFRPVLGRHDLSGMDLLEHTVYRADVPAEHEAEERSVRRKHGGAPWRPAIHMPRWASRITLEITSVRVERLQDISEKDSQAEGVEQLGDMGCPCESDVEDPGPTHLAGCRFSHLDIEPDDEPHRAAFAVLWDAINGKKAPWSSNPFVWALGFQVLP